MSFNQSRSDKSTGSGGAAGEQFRKSGNRSGNASAASYQRTNSGRPSAGGGPGSYQRTNSYSKPNNVQGGQPRGSASSVNPELNNLGAPSRSVQQGQQGVQTGVSQQVPSQEWADSPFRAASAGTNAASSVLQSDPAGLKSSQPVSVSSDLKPTQTPPKPEGGPPKGFSLQFGSISPGLVNGIQIPPRTSSAPPNLDEQKRDQVQRDFLKTAPAPAVPLPSVPMHQLPVKEIINITHPVPDLQNLKKESQVSSSSSSSPQKHSGINVSSMSMQGPFHLPQGPVQMGVPPQFQPHMVPPILPKGNGPLFQQPVFVPPIQPYLVQHHGIVHQGQGINFPNQYRPQMPHQMGNMGINPGPQFTPPQAGKFGSPRRAIKITHPDTREELRLDGRGETKAQVSPKAGTQNIVPQSQPVLPVIAPQPTNYYSGSISSSGFYPPVVTVPLGTQIPPGLQTSRANYPINQSSQSTLSSKPPAANKTANSVHGQAEYLDQEKTRKVSMRSQFTNQSTKQDLSLNVESVTVNVADEVNQIGGSNARLLHGANVTSTASAALVSVRSTGVDASVLVKCPTSMEIQSTPAFKESTNKEVSETGSICRPTLVEDQQKKTSHKEHYESQPQGDGHVIAPPATTYPTTDRPSKIPQGTTNIAPSGTSECALTASSGDHMSSDVSGSPEHTISKNTLCEESEEQVHSLEDKTLETVAGEMKEETKEDAISIGNSSIANVLERHEAQDGLMESNKVSTPGASKVDLVPSAVHSDNCETSIDDPKPTATFFESKVTETRKEATINQVDAIIDNKLGSNDRKPLELNRPKSAKAKKKIKEVLQKADAAGTTSDLYTAYKGPEDKEIALPGLSSASESSVDVKPAPVDNREDALAENNKKHGKSEPDNWEDADVISSPKLKIEDKLKLSSSGSTCDANEMKYTRDFLMKFRDQCNTLPNDFIIPQEMSRALLASNVSSTKVDRSASDRSLGTSRTASFSSRDQRGEFVYGNNMGRPGSGGNSGVHRHPRGQAGHHPGGILPGHLQPSNSFHRENAEGDRWQKASNYQKGLNSSPQTPAQMMHKAEKKYEVGKVADEEQAKQRQLKGILNKLTPQNFQRLFEQVKAVHIENADTLTGVISQIFDKALMEPTFCEMYADFCYHLSGELPDFTEGDKKITFKRVLLNKCQEEFERGEREQEEANKVEEEGDVAQSNEEREEKRVEARRRMLGNIRLIGELYKKKMLTERIMHECIKKLLGQQQNADEEDIEALCKLMSTIGEMIDHPKAKTHMDAYFERMLELSNDMKYSSRVRFMLKDSIDLRKNKWHQRRKVEGPKKIEDVHRDAAHERQAQSSRLNRTPSMSASNRRGPSSDFGSRGSSILPSPNSQPGEYRNFPSQARGHGSNQDVRVEDRQPLYENRNVSVPLPQRGSTVTLGPQGGLARGMSMRGTPPAHITQTPGLNGSRPLNERTAHNSNDSALPRSASGRLVVSAYSQPSGLEHNISPVNEMSSGRTTDRPVSKDLAQPTQSLSEERLRTMCTSTIKEFYSAKDEKEVALCIKDMNAPNFYPSMIALWVTDSFERKDVERNLLSRLLVSLAKSEDNTLTHKELLEGFESVLTTLEDAVNDAPKAPEFLGRVFASMFSENVIPLGDIREIVHKGGEEPGSLVESGLAGDVIGSILEVIQSEKGDSYLNEIRTSLNLEDFKPSHPSKSRKLEKFL